METIIIDGLAFALPLFIIAIGGIYCERSGITNLALEGLMGMGAFTGALAVVLTQNLFPAQSSIPFYIAIFFAMLGSMIYAMLHGLLLLLGMFYIKQDMVCVYVHVGTIHMQLMQGG